MQRWLPAACLALTLTACSDSHPPGTAQARDACAIWENYVFSSHPSADQLKTAVADARSAKRENPEKYSALYRDLSAYSKAQAAGRPYRGDGLATNCPHEGQ